MAVIYPLDAFIILVVHHLCQPQWPGQILWISRRVDIMNFFHPDLQFGLFLAFFTSSFGRKIPIFLPVFPSHPAICTFFPGNDSRPTKCADGSNSGPQ
jgi:hypothetical protein